MNYLGECCVVCGKPNPDSTIRNFFKREEFVHRKHFANRDVKIVIADW